MSAAIHKGRRFIVWGAVLGIAVLIYWVGIRLSRPIEYRHGAVRVSETTTGVLIQLPNFSLVHDLQCFSSGRPKHIVSPSWAATQEVWLEDKDCMVVVRSFTYDRGSAERVMQRWVSDLTSGRSLTRERATVSNHPALKLSAPGTLYLFVVWDDAKLLELQADGCRDQEHQRCLRKLIDSLELR